MIAIPDELVEQVKSVARTEALEKFFINAARKQVRVYRWRTMAYGLRRMEKEYDFKREAQSSRRSP